MVAITGILCPIYTSGIEGAGGEGRVYLGIAGREFRLDSKATDFKRGEGREYLLGALQPVGQGQVTVNDPKWNDPRLGWQLDTNNLARHPKYIRYEPGSGDENWNVGYAGALIYKGNSDFVAYYQTGVDFENLWLGKRSGMVLHLTDEFVEEEKAMRLIRSRRAG